MLIQRSPPAGGQSPMTAERLRSLIVLSLTERADVVACRPVKSIYRDRLAVTVVDGGGWTWRLHMLTEPASIQ